MSESDVITDTDPNAPDKVTVAKTPKSRRKIDPDTTYNLELDRSISFFGVTLAPRDNVTMDGASLIKVLADPVNEGAVRTYAERVKSVQAE